MAAPTLINLRQLPIGVIPVAIAAASGNFTVLAAVATKEIRVWGMILSASVAQTLTVFSDTDAITGAMTLNTQPFILPMMSGWNKRDSGYPYFQTSVGAALKMTSSAGTISGIVYCEQVVPLTM